MALELSLVQISAGAERRGDNDIELAIVIEVAQRGAAMTAKRLGGRSNFICQCRPLGPGEVAEDGTGLVDFAFYVMRRRSLT